MMKDTLSTLVVDMVAMAIGRRDGNPSMTNPAFRLEPRRVGYKHGRRRLTEQERICDDGGGAAPWGSRLLYNADRK